MRWRECEFIKIDDLGNFIGAMKNSPSWDRACKQEAVKVWKFENHAAWLCQRHYDLLVKWVETFV